MTATITTIGNGISRKDGRVKVCGAADYTADHRPENLLYAVYASSPAPHGRIAALDTDAARRADGVVAVLTHENLPQLPPLELPAGQTFLPLQADRILHEGQPIALVLADTLERATYAASLVTARIEPAPHRTGLVEHFDDRHLVEGGYDEPDTHVGDAEAALRSAEARIAARYTIAHRHHTAMEPSATIAAWDGDELTTWDATQHIWGVQSVLAAAFGIPAEKIRVISHYLGGGFGCKGYVWPHQILAPLAARVVGRPVKLVLTRAQTFVSHGYQSATVHDVALGARRDGTLTAIVHDVAYANAIADHFPEYAAAGTRSMYAAPAIVTTHRAVKLNLPQPTAMRAPNEGMGNFALESALDELAAQLGIDPLELRLRNYAEHDPTSGLPFSSKKLREAYALGAARFGWARRDPRPRAQRDGDDFVGYGMASCLMTTYRMGSGAAVAMRSDGTAIVRAGAQEIGTGVRTVMPQIAADVLGLDPDRVTMELGDTRLPQAGPTYGSSSTMGVGSAVADAAAALREKLRALGAEDSDGYAQAAARAGGEVVARGSFAPAGGDAYAMFGFGAVFVEVRVDASLGIVRVRRCVGAYSAGRIINAKTATSQMTGGMIWGIGQALLERSEADRHTGRFLSKNLAGYLIPSNRDVGELEAYFVDEYDAHASTIGARGIGELGATGVAAAVANAVYHATGVRVRDLPITPEKLLMSRTSRSG